ncbi:hypothetical protein [Bacteroidetes bacterium endosymbiont of Geopemphigus sp.]|uniref:hypothetical protein n=1 Tax=Bacteroidetes bacterium endosymbiont of Geopemphigus sp. TaxID=2047937 RepID=UPI0011AEF25A|nr:hypothetical protein [Bacteroidetes bacterium endosymbiont of Geopemphigus sp.]
MAAYRVIQDQNDKLATGNLYQWGRESDSNECWKSKTTDINLSSDRPRHGKFVTLGNLPTDGKIITINGKTFPT